MTRVSKKSPGRPVLTPHPVAPVSMGIIGCRKKPTGSNKSTVTIPGRVKAFICKNIGGVTIKFNFNDDNQGQHCDLEPGEWLPCPIPIESRTKIHLVSPGGASTMQFIFWG